MITIWWADDQSVAGGRTHSGIKSIGVSKVTYWANHKFGLVAGEIWYKRRNIDHHSGLLQHDKLTGFTLQVMRRNLLPFRMNWSEWQWSCLALPDSGFTFGLTSGDCSVFAVYPPSCRRTSFSFIHTNITEWIGLCWSSWSGFFCWSFRKKRTSEESILFSVQILDKNPYR